MISEFEASVSSRMVRDPQRDSVSNKHQKRMAIKPREKASQWRTLAAAPSQVSSSHTRCLELQDSQCLWPQTLVMCTCADTCNFIRNKIVQVTNIDIY